MSAEQSPVSEFQAVVTEIREAERIQGRSIFQVALSHSQFPLGVGEPVGTLTAVAPSGAVLVAPVTAVHQDASGERWHTTQKPLQPGTQVVAQVFL